MVKMYLHRVTDNVRLGAMVVTIVVVIVCLAVPASSAKQRGNTREIMSQRPKYLGTAIGFGKRESLSESSDYDKHRSTMMSLRKLLIFQFLQHFRINPELTKKIVRQLLFNDVDDTLSPTISAVTRRRNIGINTRNLD